MYNSAVRKSRGHSPIGRSISLGLTLLLLACSAASLQAQPAAPPAQSGPAAQSDSPKSAAVSTPAKKSQGTLSERIPTTALKVMIKEGPTELFDRQPETLADLRTLEQVTTRLIPNYQAATVGIQVGQGQGSGVVISPEGYVLTAAHVVGEVGNRVTIIFPDGRRHRAVVAGVDAGVDAAIVRTEGKGPYPYVPMAENEFARSGRWVIAIGHPNGYAFNRLPVVRLGRVIQTTEKTVQTDCSLVGGDSGGPLFDLNGRVVGIHSRIGINNSINFHVPVEVYLKDWNELTAGYEPDHTSPEKPRAQKAYLGIRGRDSATAGCLVTEVTPSGPAAVAGIQRGDLILTCNNEKVTSFAKLVEVLKKYGPDDEIQIKISRAGKTETFRVQLGGTEI